MDTTTLKNIPEAEAPTAAAAPVDTSAPKVAPYVIPPHLNKLHIAQMGHRVDAMLERLENEEERQKKGIDPDNPPKFKYPKNPLSPLGKTFPEQEEVDALIVAFEVARHEIERDPLAAMDLRAAFGFTSEASAPINIAMLADSVPAPSTLIWDPDTILSKDDQTVGSAPSRRAPPAKLPNGAAARKTLINAAPSPDGPVPLGTLSGLGPDAPGAVRAPQLHVPMPPPVSSYKGDGIAPPPPLPTAPVAVAAPVEKPVLKAARATIPTSFEFTPLPRVVPESEPEPAPLAARARPTPPRPARPVIDTGSHEPVFIAAQAMPADASAARKPFGRRLLGAIGGAAAVAASVILSLVPSNLGNDARTDKVVDPIADQQPIPAPETAVATRAVPPVVETVAPIVAPVASVAKAKAAPVIRPVPNVTPVARKPLPPPATPTANTFTKRAKPKALPAIPAEAKFIPMATVGHKVHNRDEVFVQPGLKPVTVQIFTRPEETDQAPIQRPAPARPNNNTIFKQAEGLNWGN
jgi:hypothetical protein